VILDVSVDGGLEFDDAGEDAVLEAALEGAQKSWRRLDGHNQLPKSTQDVKFIDGVEKVRQDDQTAVA
jgi:hypothetical protein